MPVTTNVADLRRLAKRRMPRAVFDFIDGGAYDERTLRANSDDFAALGFRQRVAIDVDARQLATRLLGQEAKIPLALAPIGLGGLARGNAEIRAAGAAGRFGVPYILSTMSACSIEEISAALPNPIWFQLYMLRDRGFVKALVERAEAAGCPVLVLTVDMPVLGQRQRDLKNKLNFPLRLDLANIWDFASHPGWTLDRLRAGWPSFGNLEGHIPDAHGMRWLAQWIGSQFDPTLTWEDVAWIREIWPRKLILKGILDVEDARSAADSGADGIVVSNHGGRQLDGAASTISALPGIAEAVGDRLEILLDSGVRSGQDLLKALALGAHGCLIGKAFLYGLGARGEAGVTEVLETITKELDTSMALTGLRDVHDASPDILRSTGEAAGAAGNASPRRALRQVGGGQSET